MPPRAWLDEPERMPAWVWCKERWRKLVELALRPDDDADTRVRKTILTPLSLLVTLVVLMVLVNDVLFLSEVYPLYIITMAYTIGMFGYVTISRSLTMNEFLMFMLGLTVFVMMWDVHVVQMVGQRGWPMFVLVVDALLVCKVRKVVTLRYLALMTVWLCLCTLEEAVRFGLFDIGARQSQYDSLREMASCEKPPCATGIKAVNYLTSAFLVFFVDYLVTRGFSSRLFAEQARMETAIATADEVANALAEFDLDCAEAVLDGNDSLPERLSDGFRSILANLRAYRPFLPTALFEHVDTSFDSDTLSPALAPGLLNNYACLVFTDVVGSTAIWEASPGAMKKALRLHNKVMRECATAHDGYEVKIIGDAFMLAFGSIVSGLNFGLDVQQRLLDAAWPPALYELPQCAKEDDVWGGLTVRIGVNFGEVDIELNDITGRIDYFGSTVNVAARIESNGVGGFVAVAAEAVSAARGSNLSTFYETTLGEVSLKGVSGKTVLSLLVPESLQKRQKKVDFKLKDSRRHHAVSNCRSGGERSSVGSAAASGLLQPTVRLQERMEKVASVSAAHVTIAMNEDKETYECLSIINDRLARIVGCLDRSDGSVIAVIASSVALGWNTTKRTTVHFESAMHFANLLCGSLKGQLTEANGRVSMGLATGPALCGNVGTGHQRFVTVIGRCVSLSAQLCDAAQLLGTFALYASPALNHFFLGIRSNCKGLVRPVDCWPVDTNETIDVYEISVATLQESNLSRLVVSREVALEGQPAESTLWTWSDEYAAAFEAKDWKTILAHAEEASDPVLATVATVLRGDYFLRNPSCSSGGYPQAFHRCP
ncbi:Adenylate cyclase [Diplonema papillatum]|nr:Adenylate cyclase [Diplonema papillatum]